MTSNLRLCALLCVALTVSAWAREAPRKGRNSVVIRDQSVDVYYYPGGSNGTKVLFAPGDGGWHGKAVTMAETIASWGYNVFGLDTKDYLEAFTGKTTLGEAGVMSDIDEVAKWLAPEEERVGLVGWSEGAGLMVLAAASTEHSGKYFGLVTMGLSDSNVLGWRWKDNLTYLTKGKPNEPTFSSLAYIDKVSPLRLVMLQSANDEYVSQDEARKLFETAREPKRFFTIQADNHRFDGNPQEFYRQLRGALAWISRTSK